MYQNCEINKDDGVLLFVNCNDKTIQERQVDDIAESVKDNDSVGLSSSIPVAESNDQNRKFDDVVETVYDDESVAIVNYFPAVKSMKGEDAVFIKCRCGRTKCEAHEEKRLWLYFEKQRQADKKEQQKREQRERSDREKQRQADKKEQREREEKAQNDRDKQRQEDRCERAAVRAREDLNRREERAREIEIIRMCLSK